MSRFQTLSGRLDVAVIGGGAIGAGVARDAARRGLRVALFEQHDFGSGTTAASTRLIHGGLRYLESADIRLVRMDLRERETLLRIAPHLVRPLEFLLPFYGASRRTRLKVRAGMLLYDALSFAKSVPGHRMLPAAEVRAREPRLAPHGLGGAAAYFDAQAALPERLCLENVLDAESHGASAFNYAEVTGALTEGGRITGVRVRDRLNGAALDVRARTVINAAGPWLDRVARRLELSPAPRLRTTMGIHLVLPSLTTCALALVSPVDRRLVFAIPWLDHTLVGTTDTDMSGDPGRVRPAAEHISYLLRSVQPYLPSVTASEIRFTTAGVRALVSEEGRPSAVSRLHRIVDGERSGAPGLVSIVGGKLTGYRAIAEEAVDQICRVLGLGARCSTADAPLPGARPRAAEAWPAAIAPETRLHLRDLYGERAIDVARLAAADASLAERLEPLSHTIAAQVLFAVRHEQGVRLADVMCRRTTLGFAADQGEQAVARVAALMAAELGWSSATRDEEVRAYRKLISRSRICRDAASRDELDCLEPQTSGNRA